MIKLHIIVTAIMVYLFFKHIRKLSRQTHTHTHTHTDATMVPSLRMRAEGKNDSCES